MDTGYTIRRRGGWTRRVYESTRLVGSLIRRVPSPPPGYRIGIGLLSMGSGPAGVLEAIG